MRAPQQKQDQKIDNAPLIGSNATVTSQYDLHREVAVATWSIDRNFVTYEKADSHTLSLYLKGGESSHRHDQNGNHGWAGSLCLMPQGHLSRWHIGGQIDFAHLYFSDRILKQFAADHYDQDVRLFDLRDLTYQEDAKLKALMTAYLAHCQQAQDHLDLNGEQLLFQILGHLIDAYNGHDTKTSPIKGGLAPRHIRTVRAAILDNLGTRQSIQDLAALTGLSPYHFARQFKESFGEAPAQYIGRQRVEAVKEFLRTDASLASIAAHTGFAQQSHMTEQFRRHTGQTPNAYRHLLRH